MEKQQIKSIELISPLGNPYFPLEPAIGAMSLEEVAHVLSNLPRWCGALPRFKSVAEHSIEVLEIVQAMDRSFSPEAELYALLHDAGEAAIGADLPSPLKKAMLPEIREIENMWVAAFVTQAGADVACVDHSERLAIKGADNEAMEKEKQQLLDQNQPLPLVPNEARKAFIAKLDECRRKLAKKHRSAQMALDTDKVEAVAK